MEKIVGFVGLVAGAVVIGVSGYAYQAVDFALLHGGANSMCGWYTGPCDELQATTAIIPACGMLIGLGLTCLSIGTFVEEWRQH